MPKLSFQYNWKPFLDGVNGCNLLCYPQGYNYYRELAEKGLNYHEFALLFSLFNLFIVLSY